jgi:hypothetical protein
VSAGADLVVLDEMTEGLDRIALTEETRIESGDGLKLAPRDIRPGMLVRATGPAAGGIVHARQLTVLGRA